MNKIIDELVKERENYIVFHVPPGSSEFDAWLRTALTKAYEAGQVVGQIEMGKWVLYTNTGGRSGIYSKIDAIAEYLKAKTDDTTTP